MTAIITDKLKTQLARSLYDELVGSTPGDSDNYYTIAVGRSQQYDPVANTDVAPTPTNTEREERLFRYNIQSLKAVEAFSFVVPIYDWTSNTIYAQYNDNQAGQPAQSYYVRTAANNVYLCIRQGKNTNGVAQVSTVKPDHTDRSLPVETDGYIWKYLYTITVSNANSFLTSQFMPVEFIDSAKSSDVFYSQFLVQDSAVPGQVVGYRVTEAGGPYSSAPDITIRGNGTDSAKARAILNTAGGIAAIEIGDSANAPIIGSMGAGYDYANIEISTSTLNQGGTAATAVPVFGPKAGLGADPRDDLRSTSIMFNIKPEGSVDKKWITGNDYRQVAVIKNILEYDSTGSFTGTAGNALKKMTLTANPGSISYANDIEVTGSTSGAKAYLDMVDSSVFSYHQDETTGFKAFSDGEVVTVEGYTGSTLTTDSAARAPDVDVFSGDILYIDNRATSTTRDLASTEDIKVIIKL